MNKMEIYHGTDNATSQNIIDQPNFIDTTKGGGELGMGFYTSDNPALVAIWAKGRYGKGAKIIEFKFEISDFIKLDIHLIRKRDKLNIFWKRIKSLKQRLTYLFHKDVVMAPFATIDICIQYKFESKTAQDFINKSFKKIL